MQRRLISDLKTAHSASICQPATVQKGRSERWLIFFSAHADGSNSLPGPANIARLELANGIVVLCRANPASSSLVLSGSLPAGSLYDPDEKLGLAGFTASALMRGTHRRSFSEIYDILESAGASLGFSGGTHSVSFSGRALAEDLESVLMLLAEALQQPAFPRRICRTSASANIDLPGDPRSGYSRGGFAGVRSDRLLQPPIQPAGGWLYPNRTVYPTGRPDRFPSQDLRTARYAAQPS